MSKYKILVNEVHRYCVEVEADTPEDAEEIADEGLTSGDVVVDSFVKIDRECTVVSDDTAKN